MFNCRYLDAATFEMTCTLTIEATHLHVPLGYKYVVYSPRMREEEDCFESLYYTDPEEDQIRCLKVDFKRVYESMSILLFATRDWCFEKENVAIGMGETYIFGIGVDFTFEMEDACISIVL